MNCICAVHTVARKDIVKNTPLIIARNIAQHSITPATKVIVYNTLGRFAETKTNLNHKDCKLIKVNCKVPYLMLCVLSTTEQSQAIDHHIYSKFTNSWKGQPSSPQPYIKLSVRIKDQNYLDLGFQHITNHSAKTINIPAMAYTGCQSCLARFQCIKDLGMAKKIWCQSTWKCMLQLRKQSTYLDLSSFLTLAPTQTEMLLKLDNWLHKQVWSSLLE